MPRHRHAWWHSYLFDNPLRRLLHHPERMLEPYVREGMNVLDLGSGMGFFSIAMARMVGPQGHVDSVDLEPKRLHVLAKRAARAGVADRITTHAVAVEQLDLGRQFDFALAFWFMHEPDELDAACARIHDHLKPGACLLVVEPQGHVSPEEFVLTADALEAAGLHSEPGPEVRRGLTDVFRR